MSANKHTMEAHYYCMLACPIPLISSPCFQGMCDPKRHFSIADDFILFIRTGQLARLCFWDFYMLHKKP